MNAKEGQQIPLNSIVAVPHSDREARLRIEYRRNDVSEEFVRDVFLKPNKSIAAVHPFLQRGIRVVLTKTTLEVEIHTGVYLHLRNDIPYLTEYKTFTNEKVVARVMNVQGNAYVSTDVEKIRSRLSDVYVEWPGKKSNASKVVKNPDGSTSITVPFSEADLPRNYPPVRKD